MAKKKLDLPSGIDYYMPMARKTTYKPEYCEQVIEYFKRAEPFTIRLKTALTKDGREIEVEEKVANPPPFLSKFARDYCGVTRKCLWDWSQKYPDFADALEMCKEIVEEYLIQNGLNGLYNPSMCIFTAKNVIGWRDRQDLSVDGRLTTVIRHPAKKTEDEPVE